MHFKLIISRNQKIKNITQQIWFLFFLVMNELLLFYLLYRVYLFGTKHLLRHLVALDIDVLNLNHLVNETIFSGVKPFHVVMFPMDQGWKIKITLSSNYLTKKSISNSFHKNFIYRGQKKWTTKEGNMQNTDEERMYL